MHMLCRIDELPVEGAREFTADGQSIVVVQRDGQIHTWLNWCPHLGIELNFQPDVFLDSDNQFIQCANHGALFEIDTGHCLSGPCSGDKLVAVQHSVRGDELWVDELPKPV